MPQVKQLYKKPLDSILTDRFDGLKSSITPAVNVAETYVVYSIYYAGKPEDGYVVYSNDQNGWDFFGYMPAKQQPAIERLARTKLSNLL